MRAVSQIVIPIRNIVAVQRANIAVIIPNSIKIITKKETFFFASFMSREDAFRLINGFVQGDSL